MNSRILKITITIILAIAALIVFAQDKVLVGHLTESPVHIDSLTGYKHFKAKAEQDLQTNRKIIEQLKSVRSKGNNETSANYRNMIYELEETNDEMAIKIGVCDMISINNWNSFKHDFSDEMITLKTILKNISE